MKKRIAAGVLALVLALGMTPIPANFVQDTVMTASATGYIDTWKVGDLYFKIYSDGTAVLVDYKGSAGSVVIPGQITIDVSFIPNMPQGTYIVTGIGKSAFLNNEKLNEVTIPDSVESIEAEAFFNCKGLKSVKYGNNIKSIGSDAFAWCENLTEAVLPDSLTNIEAYAFVGCKSIKNIKIPDSLTKIEGGVFSQCSGLTNVTFNENLKRLEGPVFCDCTSLKKVTIPKTIESIGDDAFGFYYVPTEDDSTVFYLEKLDDFKIYCYSGTDAERYAKENGFDYELLDKKPSGGNNNPSGGNNNPSGGNNNPGGGNETVNISAPGLQKFSASENASRINWNKVEGADGYRVYKYENGKWKTLKTINNGDTTTYRDSGLKAGTTYKYKIKAFVRDSAGKTVWGSASATITTATKPSKPTISKASKSKTAVRLYWNKVAGASGYKIQQYDNAAKKWKTVKVLNATNYKVTGLQSGTAYKFRIQAYKNAGGQKSYSDWSSTKKATTK